MIELEIAVLPLRARPPIYNIKSKNMVGSYDKHWLAGTEVVPRATAVNQERNAATPTELLIYWWARQDSNLQPDRYERRDNGHFR
ncbi:hypothetical protein [Bradyrhizobium guangdongense]|uniref:hypothetical protein n=1 Tax=Bradyrhizobium guangdongense TaxID=1325090 RepID=UPI00131A0B4B|nr:hypothetical protein [Bradyrhizobium guangdongense]